MKVFVAKGVHIVAVAETAQQAAAIINRRLLECGANIEVYPSACQEINPATHTDPHAYVL